jgi:hypothetical protein
MSGVLLAWTSPVDAENESEFNRWYDEVHIPQVKNAVPSITDVQRFRAVDPADPSAGDARYLCQYSFTGDVAEAAAGLGRATVDGTLDQTPAMDANGRPPELIWAQAL